MARFITTKEISAEIDRTISTADKRIVLITPYVRTGGLIQEKLHAAGNRGKTIILVCREEDLKEDQKQILLSIPGLQLFAHTNVHAKCYYNEHQLVMGSLNLVEYSSQNNREMGVVFDRKIDSDLYSQAVNEGEEIITMASRTGKSFNQKSNSVSSQSYYTKEKSHRTGKKSEPNFLEKLGAIFSHEGFCIRCKTELNLNPSYPFCPECYASWAKWGNPDFEEKYCHCCGNNKKTSMNRPLCIDCFRKRGF